MNRTNELDVGEDLGVASIETRGNGISAPEPGGKLLTMPGIADDD